MINRISLKTISNDDETLLSVMKESLFIEQQVNISTARFL